MHALRPSKRSKKCTTSTSTSKSKPQTLQGVDSLLSTRLPANDGRPSALPEHSDILRPAVSSSQPHRDSGDQAEDDVIFVKATRKRKRSTGLLMDDALVRVDNTRNAAPAAQLSTLKECTVCYEKPGNHFFPFSVHGLASTTCRSVCYDCWDQHLEVEIDTKSADRVSCAQCSRAFTSDELKSLATKQCYTKWLDKAAKCCRENDEEFRSCPSATCNWGCFFSTREDGNIFSCRLCDCRYCVVCEAPMHEDETCESYQERPRTQQRELENQQSEQAVKTMSKPCPNCGVNLDKYVGCDHVTCSRPSCREEFCWECSALYKGPEGIHAQGNAAHQPTCKHHPTKLPDLEFQVPLWEDEDGLI